MSPDTVRKKFLKFFADRDHKVVASAPLVDKTDPSVLLTSAGMQQFKPYFTGARNARADFGTRNTASIQKCFRTSDISAVGDATHLTFFEMLGNFSFGGYFKEEAIKLAYQLLNEEYAIARDRMRVTVFGGDREVPRDQEALAAWQKLGFSEANGNLTFAGRADNFWGPTGAEGPCGATSEVYVDGVEVWNLVFNEYYCDQDKKLRRLKQKGVDTGMGLERMMMALEGKRSVFATALFRPLIKVLVEQAPPAGSTASSLETLFDPATAVEIELEAAAERASYVESVRLLADHLRGAIFLAAEGLAPSNVQEGYILRRVLRRAIRRARRLRLEPDWLLPFVEAVLKTYGAAYPELVSNRAAILDILRTEKTKFERTLAKGLTAFKRRFRQAQKTGQPFTAGDAFRLYESYGFPVEITEELLAEQGAAPLDAAAFEKAFERHRRASRGSRPIGEKKIGGLRAQPTRKEVRLHTATHLLHQALRDILGGTVPAGSAPPVRQMGSDITEERLRFDFSHPRKLTDDEKRDIEKIVNEKIKAALPVVRQEMPFAAAVKRGALAFFKENYPPLVSVYSIGRENKVYSCEVCRGPHVENTAEIGRFEIIKEEAVGAGVRRIKATVH